MTARLLAVAAATLLFFFMPLQPAWPEIDPANQMPNLDKSELPSALAEDDSFDDLPFEQLRQALREEVEMDPQRSRSHQTIRRYNLLIR